MLPPADTLDYDVLDSAATYIGCVAATGYGEISYGVQKH